MRVTRSVYQRDAFWREKRVLYPMANNKTAADANLFNYTTATPFTGIPFSTILFDVFPGDTRVSFFRFNGDGAAFVGFVSCFAFKWYPNIQDMAERFQFARVVGMKWKYIPVNQAVVNKTGARMVALHTDLNFDGLPPPSTLPSAAAITVMNRSRYYRSCVGENAGISRFVRPNLMGAISDPVGTPLAGEGFRIGSPWIKMDTNIGNNWATDIFYLGFSGIFEICLAENIDIADINSWMHMFKFELEVWTEFRTMTRVDDSPSPPPLADDPAMLRDELECEYPPVAGCARAPA